jgi:hypothetical protein
VLRIDTHFRIDVEMEIGNRLAGWAFRLCRQLEILSFFFFRKVFYLLR